MPLNAKASKVLRSMIDRYGKDKGERIFYATANKRKLTPETWEKKAGTKMAEATPAPSLWDQTKDLAGQAWDTTKNYAGQAWDATKDWAGKPGYTGLGMNRGTELGVGLGGAAILAWLLSRRRRPSAEA